MRYRSIPPLLSASKYCIVGKGGVTLITEVQHIWRLLQTVLCDFSAIFTKERSIACVLLVLRLLKFWLCITLYRIMRCIRRKQVSEDSDAATFVVTDVGWL